VVRRAIRYERHGAHGRPRAFLRLTAALRAERYAAHVVLPSTPSAAVFARLVSAPLRAGFAGPGRRLCFTRCARRGPRGSAHLLEEYRRVLALLDWNVPAAEPAGVVGAAAAARAAELTGPGPYAVLVPGAIFGPTKRWPAAGFAASGAALAARHGLGLVLVGAPGDRPATAAVGAALRGSGFPADGVVDLAGRTDIPTLAAVLAGAAVVVSTDSGPMHLARAVGAPTVGVFGSTEPRWTAPRGGSVVVAPERPPCAPCYQRRCKIDFICLTRIEPDRVTAAAAAELSRAGDDVAGAGRA
jgi:heptosyltransferase-2